MTAATYKFLAAGSVGRFSGFAWPAGEWVQSDRPLEACTAGIHACRVHELLDWLDDELWEIELAGAVEETSDLLLAERGRLVRRVETWSPETARALTEWCVGRTQELDGDENVTALAADVVSLSHGRRPDTQDLGLALAEPAPAQSPASTAANVAYVAAHVVGVAAGGGGYERAFAAERAEQLAWLVDALRLYGAATSPSR